MSPRPARLLPLLLLTAAASGCGTLQQQGDWGPSKPMDLSGVPDPVPRWEPPSAYGNPETYSVAGQSYRVLTDSKDFVQRGIASWYGRKFHGRLTSNREPYNMYAMTAAHKTLPLPTYVQVTNLDNGRTAIVRVNDRGPFKEGRIIDLSFAAASRLGIVKTGTGRVEIRAIDPRRPLDMPLPGTVTAVTEQPGAEVIAAPAALVPTPRLRPIDANPAAPDAAEAAARAPRPPRKPPVPGPVGEVFLQAGAFGERSNAERLRTRLAEQQTHPVRVESSTGPKAIHRVWLGPFAEAESQQVQADLEAQGIGTSRVFSQPKPVDVARETADAPL